MKLYTYPNNKNAYKSLIVAAYGGLNIEIPPFKMGLDNKTNNFLEKNPFGKVPVLETEKGCIFESNAIARYLAKISNNDIYGSNHLEFAHIEQWIDFSSNEIDAPLNSWVLPLVGLMPYDKKKEQAAITAIKDSLCILNDYLENCTYLVGNSISLADIITTCNLYNGFTKVFDKEFRNNIKNVERYFTTLINQPEFKKIMGNVTICDNALKFTQKKNSEKDAKIEKDSTEKKEEEKPKSWIDLLPPTSMPLDSFKRLYSNCPAKNFKETFFPLLYNGGPIPNSPSEEV